MKYSDQCIGGFTEGFENFSDNMKINHGRDITGHNLYLLQTVDRDNNITGEAYGVNVLTDIGLKQICSSYVYLGEYGTNKPNCYVYIGKGTGTPSLSDTTLFDKIVSFSATYVSGSDSSHRRPCKYDKTSGIWTGYKGYYQGYFDYNISGITEEVNVTEVGLGSSITNLYTHALVYDSDGNPSSIKKRINERLYITIQFCANININLIKNLWEQQQYLLAQPTSCIGFGTNYASQELIYGDPKSRMYVVTYNGTNKEYPFDDSTMYDYFQVHNSFSFNDHVEKCNITFNNGIMLENKYSMCTKTISIFCKSGDIPAQQDDLDSYQYSLTTLENLDEPEELVSSNIWTNRGCKSNKLTHNFGDCWRNGNYGQGYLPAANFVIESLRMYNHQTKAWDIEENFTQLSPNTFESSFVDSRLPIYVSLDGKSATYYVTQNITTEVAVSSFSNQGCTVYATDEYWDTDTWEMIGNLSSVDESLQYKKYYISTSSDALTPSRKWNSLPTVIPPKLSYTFQSRIRSDYLNILSNDEKGCVMLADQIVYPELTQNVDHTIEEGKCSIFLFTINEGNPIDGDKNPVDHWGYGKLYSFDIYESDVLVRHFVPCYKLNEDSSKTFGVYETKLQKFHPFVGKLLFPTITSSSSYNSQGAEVDLSISEIPTDQQSEYKQIEYLNHTGNDYNSINYNGDSRCNGYIDTEYIHKTTTKVVWDGVAHRNWRWSYNALFGSRWLNQHKLIFFSNYYSNMTAISEPRFVLNHYTNTLPKTMTLGTRIKIEAGCLDHEQILHGCNIYNQSTNELIDTTGQLNYDAYSHASYIYNNSCGYTRRWAMADKFISIGDSYGKNIVFYNIPDDPSEEIIAKATSISEFTDTSYANYKYYTFSGEDTGYLTIQRLGYNDCAIVNCNGDTPTYTYLTNTQKCTAILQTKYCVYRTTTNATTLEFEIYDMENNNVVDTFALPPNGYSLLWIVGWKNRIYVEVKLNSTCDIYYYDMDTKQLRHVEGISIPALSYDYSCFDQYYQYINVVANDEMLIISNAYNVNQLHKIYDSDPLKIYTCARASDYLAGKQGLQLKYLDNKKHLLLLFAYYHFQHTKYAYVEDVGMYMDNVNTEYTYPSYHFIGGNHDAYGGTQDIIAGFYKNGVIVNETNTSTYTWSPIEYWLPHEITGTTTTIQSYNNPRKLYGKSYEFKITNDTTKFEDE